MPELYDHILCDRCYAVRLMLNLCGVAYGKRTVRYEPDRTEPVFVDDDCSISGPTPILRYLAAKYQPQRWRAGEPEVEDWLAFAEGRLTALPQARVVRLFGAPDDLSPLIVLSRAALRAVEDHLTERHLRGEEWLVGSEASLADIVVFPPVMLSHDAGIGHEDYPAINCWQRRVRRLNGFVSMPGIPDYF